MAREPAKVGPLLYKGESPYVSIEVLSKYFAVSVSTVRSWVRTGTIPRDMYVKIGNTYRYEIARIIAYFTNVPDVQDDVAPQGEAPAEVEAPEVTNDQLALAFENN